MYALAEKKDLVTLGCGMQLMLNLPFMTPSGPIGMESSLKRRVKSMGNGHAMGRCKMSSFAKDLS